MKKCENQSRLNSFLFALRHSIPSQIQRPKKTILPKKQLKLLNE